MLIFSAHSVILPIIILDELGVPIKIAKNLTSEVVNNINKVSINKLLEKGVDTWLYQSIIKKDGIKVTINNTNFRDIIIKMVI